MTQSFDSNDLTFADVPSNFRVVFHSQIFKRETENVMYRQYMCLFMDATGDVLAGEPVYQDSGENKICSTFPELDESKWIGEYHQDTSFVLVFNRNTHSFTNLSSYEEKSVDHESMLRINTVGIAQDLYNAARNGDNWNINSSYVNDVCDDNIVIDDNNIVIDDSSNDEENDNMITFIDPCPGPMFVVGNDIVYSTSISNHVVDEVDCDEKHNLDDYLNEDC